MTTLEHSLRKASAAPHRTARQPGSRRHVYLPILLLLTGIILLVGASEATAACGGKNEKACCVCDRIPSCDKGLYEKTCSGLFCSTGSCEGDSTCQLADSTGTCKDDGCGGNGERACTVAEGIYNGGVTPCDDRLHEDLTPEGSCDELLGDGDASTLDPECTGRFGGESFGTCTGAKSAGEACSVIGAPPCKDPLICVTVDFDLNARCFADLDGLVSKSECNALFVPSILDDAVASATTFSFGYGSSVTTGISQSIETGVAYGRDGCFSCYMSTCQGIETDLLAISTFAATGFSDVDVVCDPSDASCISFDGQGCGYSLGGDVVGDVGISSTSAYANCNSCEAIPGLECDLVGAGLALSVGVGLNPAPVGGGWATCETIQTVAGCLDENDVYQENLNQAPVCDAGTSYTEECAGSQTTIALDGGASSDPDGDPLSFSWSSACSGASFSSTSSASPDLTISTSGALTSCSASLDVSDGEESASCSATVNVEDTSAPTISCPSNKQLECSGAVDTSVAANGSATATDICDDIVAVTNTIDLIVPGSCGTLQTITRSWLATDDASLSDSCDQTIEVVDTTPPTISCPADIFAQSSPGQCTLPVSYSVTGGDSCDASPVISCTDQGGTPVSTNGDTFPVGTTAVSCTIADCAGNVSSCGFDVTVNDPPSIVSVTPPTQMVQYSDSIAPVIITATDCGPGDLTLEFDASDVPGWLSLSSTANSCALNGSNLLECRFTLNNNDRALGPAGNYTIDNLKVVDPVPLDGVVLKSSPAGTTTVQVKQEDALVSLHADNQVAIQVATDGGNSGTFSLLLDIRERGPADVPADTVLLGPGQTPMPGDIGKAVASLTLQPVGPGSPVSGSCTPVAVLPGTPVLDYGNVVTVACDFGDVPVNTYEVVAAVVGDFYVGGPDTDVFTVFDPSLGFTTGGGWFYWPGTGEKTNFGFNMKYNKKWTRVQGSLLMIRHLPDGTRYRVKSNALEGLAVGSGTGFGWASFSGKSTYQDPSMLEPIGNHSFITYVEDHGEPGQWVDRFWIEVFDKQGDRIEDSSMYDDPSSEAVVIEGGNIVVPHQTGRRSDRN